MTSIPKTSTGVNPSSTNHNPLLRSALEFAQLGLSVFPLRPATKEPFKGIGVYQSSTDPAQIRDGWQQDPNANVAIAAGQSNLLILDFDLYKAGAALPVAVGA